MGNRSAWNSGREHVIQCFASLGAKCTPRSRARVCLKGEGQAAQSREEKSERFLDGCQEPFHMLCTRNPFPLFTSPPRSRCGPRRYEAPKAGWHGPARWESQCWARSGVLSLLPVPWGDFPQDCKEEGSLSAVEDLAGEKARKRWSFKPGSLGSVAFLLAEVGQVWCRAEQAYTGPRSWTGGPPSLLDFLLRGGVLRHSPWPAFTLGLGSGRRAWGAGDIWAAGDERQVSLPSLHRSEAWFSLRLSEISLYTRLILQKTPRVWRAVWTTRLAGEPGLEFGSLESSFTAVSTALVHLALHGFSAP